jgi:hypothetical protein
MSEWWWKRRFIGKKSMPKKIRWNHDNWTLHKVYNKVTEDKRNSKRARILLSLIHLQAGISVDNITKMIGEPRKNIVGWVRQYIKNGLQVLLGVQVAVPINFRNTIERYIRSHPNVISQLLKLETDDDFEIYAEEIGVETYALQNWVYELELGGTDARKAYINSRKPKEV